MRIFVSTSCLKDSRDLPTVLDTYMKAGIRNIEVGSTHNHIEDVTELLNQYRNRYRDVKFVIHNYFPPPREPFVMNLAAQDENIRLRSLEVCRNAIELCSHIDAEFYSFHPGFRVVGTLGSDFGLSSTTVPYEVAFRSFTRSLEEIVSYARESGINVAVENLEHKNDAYIMTRPEELTRILEIFPELFVLVDLGHLKIASRRLCFKIEEFISCVHDRVIGIHLHDNDGKSDLHLMPLNSELLKYISQLECENIILESRNMDMTAVVSCLNALRLHCTSTNLKE